MPRKCCVAHCKSNYESTDEKVTVYQFPKDSQEKDRWIASLPNVIDKVTPHIGVCVKHWPSTASYVKVKRYSRPSEPPSIFPGCAPSLQRQTVSTTSRSVDQRFVTSAARTQQPDEIEEFEKQDKLPSWEEFCFLLPSKSFISDNRLTIVPEVSDTTSCRLRLLRLSENEINYSIAVNSDYGVIAMRSNTRIDIRDLLGFRWKLERWSQLEAIITRTRLHELSYTAEISCVVDSLRQKLDSCDIDDDKRLRISFLLEQFELLETSKNSRRYSSETMKSATSLFLRSRNAYSCLRNLLCLPHADTIRKQFGGLGRIGTEVEATDTINVIMSKFSGLQKNCCIMFDEIYIKPSLRFRGCHVVGEAEDVPGKAARTVLAIMLKPILTSECFVVRLVPVFSLTTEFLYDQLCRIIKIVHAHNSRVLALICDNAAVNRSCFKRFHMNSDEPWLGQNPCHSESTIFLLHDSVHILKCVRNNWLSEKTNEIKLDFPGRTVTGRWNDIIELYNKEISNVVRRTKLKHESCYPSNFELQKVSLVLDVFDEKTIAALISDGKHETAEFLSFFLRLWKILNCKNPQLHLLRNDEDRKPFTSISDSRFDFMAKAARIINQMPGDVKGIRMKSLTSATKNAFSQTLRGLAAMGKHLLNDTACKFVLFGMFQTDKVESEFGIYRQLSGGNYFISYEQILSSAHLRRLELFSKLDIDDLPMNSTPHCCNSEFSDQELECLDAAVIKADKVTLSERSALFYICGYVTFKEKLSNCSESTVSFYSDSDSEFVHLVNRGKLSFPSSSLFQFSLIAYAFFSSISNPCCANRITSALLFLNECLFFELTSSNAVCRRLTNCFMKGFVVRSKDILTHEHHKKLSDRRKRKLEKP